MEALETAKSPFSNIQFVKIPGGCFQMGTDKGFKFEVPKHEVCVDSFFLATHETTQRQWDLLMEENRSRFKGDERPVERVSWNDAKEFIRRLNEKENTDRYRLPTEAEWERAARAGGDTRFFWGEEMSEDFCWYFGNSDYQTHPVGQKRPNPWGLYDMAGNVWEWTEDWYDFGWYKKSPKDNPKGPPSGVFKVRRGGSQANLISHIQAHTRYRSKPDKRHYIFGFRIAFSDAP